MPCLGKEPNGTLSCEHLNLADLPFPMAEEEPTNGADAAPAEDAAALALAAMPGIPGMDPAAYAQWLQAVQAQQVAAQQLYLQQIAAASGGVFLGFEQSHRVTSRSMIYVDLCETQSLEVPLLYVVALFSHVCQLLVPFSNPFCFWIYERGSKF